MPRESPADYADCRLFEPIATLLRRFPDTALPTAESLNRLLADTAPDARSGSGHALRFAPPRPNAGDYEATVFARGTVPTRVDDWHDFFNALAWCVWPRTKAACNALHHREIAVRQQRGEHERGPCRDALTQFDECGLLVVSAHPDIPRLLATHQWEAAFWALREELGASTRFLVFGHGTWDSLRAPFVGLCAKTLYRSVKADWLALAPTVQQAECDHWLCQFFHRQRETLSPRDLRPLPVLGIPGTTPDNESRDYYRESRQFRPLRRIDSP